MSSWREGDRVRVLTGVFVGFRGTVVRQEGDQTIVLVRIFDRDALATIGADQLGTDDNGGGGAGVREPRRPLPPLDAAAELPERREAE